MWNNIHCFWFRSSYHDALQQWCTTLRKESLRTASWNNLYLKGHNHKISAVTSYDELIQERFCLMPKNMEFIKQEMKIGHGNISNGSCFGTEKPTLRNRKAELGHRQKRKQLTFRTKKKCCNQWKRGFQRAEKETEPVCSASVYIWEVSSGKFSSILRTLFCL